MGVKVNFSTVPDAGQGGTIPLGKYPCRLHIDAYQVDQEGNPMLDGDGKKVFFRSKKQDIQWKTRAEILEGPFAGRELFDYLTFSEGGLKRIKVLASRIGLDITGPIEMEPEDLDCSYWYVEVDSHEVAQTAQGQVKVSKYTFHRGSCLCETCKTHDGKNVNVNSKTAFAGFELMDAESAKRLSGVHKKPKGEAANGTGHLAASEENAEDRPPF